MFSTYRKYLNGWHICGNLLEFVDQQLEKWNNKTNRLLIHHGNINMVATLYDDLKICGKEDKR